MRYSDAYDIARTAGVPASLFSHVLVPFYRSSPTAKLHSSSSCSLSRKRHIPRVHVALDTLGAAKLCQCAPIFVPDSLAPLLEAAHTLSHLTTLTGRLEQTLEAASDLSMHDLAAATEARSILELAPAARSTLAAALATDPMAPAIGDAAPVTVRRTVDRWAVNTTTRAVDVLSRFDAVVTNDTLLEVRAAATFLRPRLSHVFRHATHTALRTASGVADRVVATAESALEHAVSAGADPAEQRAAVRAVVDDVVPHSSCQFPDVPVPAGMTLQTAMTTLWRAAAADQLLDLLDRADRAYQDLLESRDARVIVTYDTLDEHTAGLLARCPRQDYSALATTTADPGGGELDEDETVLAWVVPDVISRALRQLDSACVLDLPVPGGYPARAEDFTTEQATQLLTGTYVTTLVRLLTELNPDDAATAALGVAQERAA